MESMKSQDIVILLKLVSLQEQEARPEEQVAGKPAAVQGLSESEAPYSVRGLAALLGISKTEVSASLRRSLWAGLAIKDRWSGHPKPNRRYLLGFIIHGLRFVFPVRPGAVTRGVPTAFDAPMLQGRLFSGGDDICVWPAADGHLKGQSIAPLFKSVPYAARKDDLLYEYLALIDSIRIGNAREFGLAVETLSARLLKRRQLFWMLRTVADALGADLRERSGVGGRLHEPPRPAFHRRFRG